MGAELYSEQRIDIDRSRAADEFREARSSIENASEEAQLAYAIALATHWRFFLAVHGSPSGFGGQPRAAQVQFYHAFRRLQLVHQCDPHSALAVRMMGCYLLALIDRDGDFQKEAADFLNRHARKGWPDTFNVPVAPKRKVRTVLTAMVRSLVQKG